MIHGERSTTAELLARYDRPGPRYTSYPTAVEFTDELREGLYEDKLRAANEHPDDPLSVYVHLPFCEKRCLFCGCHVIVSPDRAQARPYLELLSREIELVAERLASRRTVSQLHLGGGTPTYHAPAELDALLGRFFRHFETAPGAELAVEVDPRATTFEHLDVLAAHGFNRLSLGVQDFTADVQQAIGRVQSLERTEKLIEHARDRDFRGINVDLIHGLPRQTLDGFERSVDEVVRLGADRAAVYSFAYVPWIRGHQRKLDEASFPDRDLKRRLFATARERFLAAGYEPIGMDHFAKPDDELAVARRERRLRRNFQGYTVIPASDVLGLGISAIGDMQGAYMQNAKKLSHYGRAIESGTLAVERGIECSADDVLRREVIHELMCNLRIDVPRIERTFGVDFADTFAVDLDELRVHEREGMVTISDERIEVTALGELFVRNLAMCFDRYWREKHRGEEKPVFSRTV